MGHNYNLHPDTCFKTDSKRQNLGSSEVNITFEVITNFVLNDLSVSVAGLETVETDSSTNVTTQADFEEIE